VVLAYEGGVDAFFVFFGGVSTVVVHDWPIRRWPPVHHPLEASYDSVRVGLNPDQLDVALPCLALPCHLHFKSILIVS